jgi:outer membrane murein-binding lipoprotein Lpp
MSKAAQEWSDARLNDLAATLQPLPTQVAVLTATIERLSEDNRALRDELAAIERQLLQVAWGLVAALLGAAAALIAALH